MEPASATVSLTDIEETHRCGDGCRSIFYGRYVKDWSQIIGGLTGTAGAAATVAGIIMRTYAATDDNVGSIGTALASAGVGTLASTFFLLCMRISCLKPLKEIEDQIKSLRNENLRLSGEVTKLEGHVESLEKVRDEFNLTHATAEKDIAELEHILEAKNLSEVTDKVKETVERLQVLQKLYSEFKEGVQGFASHLNSFKGTKEDFGSKVKELSKNINALDKNEDDISHEIDEFVDANKYYQDQNKKLGSLLDNLENNLSGIHGRFDEMKAAMDKLSSYVVKLDEADDKFKGGAESLEKDVIPKLQKLLNEFNALNNQMSEEDSSHEVRIDIHDDKGKGRSK